jgi:hypothetical protein
VNLKNNTSRKWVGGGQWKCRRCEEDIQLWFKCKKNSFRFGIPMMWREQQNHTTDCYFCSVDVKGFNTKNKNKISYPNFHSAIRPVPHSSEIPVPLPPSSLDDIQSDSKDGTILPPRDESSSDFSVGEGPQLFSQSELKDLVRDLDLSKDAVELLGSTLKNKNKISYPNFNSAIRPVPHSSEIQVPLPPSSLDDIFFFF